MNIDTQQLQDLINGLLENNLSDDRFSQLESILNASSEAMQVYLEQMQLESMLFDVFESQANPKPIFPTMDGISAQANPDVVN